MNYSQTLARITELKEALEVTRTRDNKTTQEFLKLKRSLCKFPEHKLKQEAKSAKII